ncbi:MAG: hypothetical protein KDA60_13440 [Planctomycetales bacterium]|nr:hypothetical protein [Planctomycetales bacterium]
MNMDSTPHPNHASTMPQGSFVLMSITLAFLCATVLTSCKSVVDPPRDASASGGSEWHNSSKRIPRSRAVLRVERPTIAGAKYVNNDALCQVCHKTYVESFEHNVHRVNRCEACHGPASKHLESRGQDPQSILSFHRMTKAQRSEMCAQCHEQDACSPGQEWRTSAHAHNGVSCTDCHSKSHYNVSEGTPTTVPDFAALQQQNWSQLVAQQLANASESLEGDTLKPKQDDRPSLRGTSNNLGAVAPVVCYQCHGEKYDLERVAHPHQLNGPHAFSCESCHNPHGNVVEHSLKGLCLQCHGSDTHSNWHGSAHDMNGVMCTDCHDPHPDANVPKLVDLQHTTVKRPPRLPMSVDDPNVCFKCHKDEYAKSYLPSHHPLPEGKMGCTDCHNLHANTDKALIADTINLTCYKCHADKQGPFVHQHAPVEENCSICHNPHGSVTNNLLHQPTTFLCLRCHTGHRSPPADHFGLGTSDIDNLAYQRPVLFTDCTQCHSQVHGTDLPSQLDQGLLLR